ncbi:MAG: GNAT family N-acetyltransferase [Aureliella sp.]
MIKLAVEPGLSASEFIDVLHRSSLAERRPVGQVDRIESMLRNASVVVTARNEDGLLVGVARAITDGAYCTYLSDLAVDEACQRQGIGRRMIEYCHQVAGKETTLILLAAPKAKSYYGHIGMQPHDSCWTTAYGKIAGTEEVESGFDDASNTKAGSDKSDFNLADVSAFFDSISSKYGEAIRRCVPRYDEMTWAMFEYLPGEMVNEPHVLELGCGTGNLTAKLIEQFPSGQLSLVDVSQSSIDACRTRFEEVCKRLSSPPPAYRNIDFHRCDFRELAYEAGSFDLVTSAISIHHLTSVEKQQLFEAICRWLRPGGYFVYADQFAGATAEIYEQHMQNWRAYTREAGASDAEWAMWMEHQDKHDYHDTLANQWSWLEKAGFAEIDCTWRHLLWTVMMARKPT